MQAGCFMLIAGLVGFFVVWAVTGFLYFGILGGIAGVAVAGFLVML